MRREGGRIAGLVAQSVMKAADMLGQLGCTLYIHDSSATDPRMVCRLTSAL